MRGSLIVAAAFAALLALPVAGRAQDPATDAASGAAAGAVTGGAIGGPPGAAVGDAVGGTIGAASQSGPRHPDRLIVEERAPAVLQKTCVEEPGRRDCIETRH